MERTPFLTVCLPDRSVPPPPGGRIFPSPIFGDGGGLTVLAFLSEAALGSLFRNFAAANSWSVQRLWQHAHSGLARDNGTGRSRGS